MAITEGVLRNPDLFRRRAREETVDRVTRAELREFFKQEVIDPTYTQKGEPIAVSALKHRETSGLSVTVFEAGLEIGEPSITGAIKVRKGDSAKRRKVILNTALKKPNSYPPTEENVNIIGRQFERVFKFAITARNKGTLHPVVQKILGL